MPTIDNCFFKFKCPMKWETLIKTAKPKIRYFPECDRGVYLCESDEKLEAAIEKDRCVTVDKLQEKEPGTSIGEVKTHLKVNY